MTSGRMERISFAIIRPDVVHFTLPTSCFLLHLGYDGNLSRHPRMVITHIDERTRRICRQDKVN